MGMLAILQVCIFAIAKCGFPHRLRVGKVVNIITTKMKGEVLRFGDKEAFCLGKSVLSFGRGSVVRRFQDTMRVHTGEELGGAGHPNKIINE